MVGVVGWGVGGIEAEAAMLGQPVSLQTPEVIGVHLKGNCGRGDSDRSHFADHRNAPQRKSGGQIRRVFWRRGCELDSGRPCDDWQYVSGIWRDDGIFPADEKTLDYLEMTGRDLRRIALSQRLFSGPSNCSASRAKGRSITPKCSSSI